MRAQTLLQDVILTLSEVEGEGPLYFLLIVFAAAV